MNRGDFSFGVQYEDRQDVSAFYTLEKALFWLLQSRPRASLKFKMFGSESLRQRRCLLVINVIVCSVVILHLAVCAKRAEGKLMPGSTIWEDYFLKVYTEVVAVSLCTYSYAVSLYPQSSYQYPLDPPQIEAIQQALTLCELLKLPHEYRLNAKQILMLLRPAHTKTPRPFMHQA